LSAESEKVERLVKLAERLIEAIEGDIAALKAGKPQAMRTTDPEIQRLSAMYSREAHGFSPNAVKTVPAPLRDRFADVTKKFRELLQLHARLLTRVRNASEGMIKAIAAEVDRRAAPMRTYNPRAAAYGKPPQAMVYNSVV
jgi:ABC-type transporter Mla subunit MlaD